MNPVIQLNLFDEIPHKSLAFEESAKLLGVSSATIRNWVKTGYLESPEKGKITLDSIQQFQREIAGREKLNLRANKSLKDNHDHTGISAHFLKLANSSEIDIAILGCEYEESLSDSYKNKEGIYYTPTEIVADLFTIPKHNLDSATFCDPCCGSGNFVMRALEIGFKPENIYAFDTDPVAVAITRQRILRYIGYASPNVRCLDFLSLVSNKQALQYDHIYTNPPWGKKLEKSLKQDFAKWLNAGTSLDTCSLFYFACVDFLNKDGTLGLLLPSAFFNVATYENARISALSLNIRRLIDYGKPFKGLITGAVGMVLEKSSSDSNLSIQCEKHNQIYYRSISTFLKNPKSILNLHCSPEEASVISHLFSIPHITLKDSATWGLGIVTGNNAKFIKHSNTQNLIPVFKGSDITPRGVKPPTHFIPADLSLYQQVAPRHLYEAEEKLIYKFISSTLCFNYDCEQRYLLNSANMVIVQKDFPVSMKILAELFNCNFMNWIFSKIFDTHKILRSDLESLPIHAQFLLDDTFCETEYLSALNIESNADGTYRIKR